MTTIRTAHATTYGQLTVGQDIWVGRKAGTVLEITAEDGILEIIVEHKDETVSLVGRSNTPTMRRAVRS